MPRLIGNTSDVLLIAALLAATDPPTAVAERSAWYDCLDTYSQVEMLSGRSPVTIAVSAATACAAERKAYRLKLFRTTPAASTEQGGSALVQFLEQEDQNAAKHVIAFVKRNR